MLAYVLPKYASNEYIKIGKYTAIQCMKRLCRAVVEVFAEWCLRSPNVYDVGELLYISNQ